MIADVLAAGAVLPEWVVESVSAAAMRQWAVFLADDNPIHLDPAAVKARGLGDTVINQGPANVAYLVNMLMQHFPAARIASLQATFLGVVYAGDRLTAGGTVTEMTPDHAVCDIWLRAEGRGPVLGGSARLALTPPSA